MARLSTVPGAYALSLPTFFEFQRDCNVYHCLELCPPSPQYEPTRRVIVLPVLVAAQTRQRIVKLMHSQVIAKLLVPPQCERRYEYRRQQLAGRALLRVGTTARVAEVQQKQRHHRQQRNDRLQTVLLRELQLLDARPRLHRFVILLDCPAALSSRIHRLCFEHTT